MALVADYKDPQTGESEIIAMGQLSRQYGTAEAECSLLVRDEFQRRGLGTEILRQLVAIGHDQQLHRIRAVVLLQNLGMLQICDKLGFRTYPAEDDPAKDDPAEDEDLIQAELVLADSKISSSFHRDKGSGVNKTTPPPLSRLRESISRVGKGRPAGSIRASGFPFPL